MKRSARYATALITLLAGSTALAADELPNYNAYADAKPAVRSLASGRTRSSALGAVTSIDEKRGVPTFFWAPPDAPKAPMALTMSPDASARFYLERYASLYGTTRRALATAVPIKVHDTGSGAIVVTFRQYVDGIEVIRNDVKVVMKQNRDLVAIAGNLHASAVAGMKRGKRFDIRPDAAIARAFSDLMAVKAPASAFVSTGKKQGSYGHYTFVPTPELEDEGLLLERPVRVKKVLFPMPDALVAGYYVEVWAGREDDGSSEAFAYVIAADDGRMLLRQNLTDSHSYRVWSEGAPKFIPTMGPQVDYLPHPTGMPDKAMPPYIAPIMITIDGFNTNPQGTFDPWLAPNATETAGNNVDAYVDHLLPDGLPGGDYRANVTAPGEFDRTYDPTKLPWVNQDQVKASITQLFYVNNFLHDYWYDSGFNEAAGNAQLSNFGRGGLENDRLQAQAQDGALITPTPNRNNANMSTPLDGSSPRMQMYVWSGPAPHYALINPGNLKLDTNTASTWGPQVFNVTADLALAQDTSLADSGGGMAGSFTDGCQALVGTYTGKIVVADRGSCNFTVKAKNAQLAGAVGVIIVNNAPGAAPGLGGSDATVTIPALSISLDDGTALKAQMQAGTVTANLVHLAPDVERDGTIDNGIIAHEWGHYQHRRLVTFSSVQGRSQSEGWGDFTAVHMLINENDDLNGTFSASVYAGAAGGDTPYFGIRRFPYSVDFTKNALTFHHISKGVPMPTGVPIGPAGLDNFEVHNAGEIWAQMMFEGYVNLIKDSTGGASPRYTFDEAKRKMADYVVGGMQAAPEEPTYTEQRDGVLAAAVAAEPLDFEQIAKAFATRGAGTCAESPTRFSTELEGVVEDFGSKAEPSFISVTVDDSVLSCDDDGVLDNGEAGKVRVKIRNVGWAPLAGTTATVVTTNPNVTFPNGATATFPSASALAYVEAEIDIALAESVTQMQDLDLKIEIQAQNACTATLNETAPLARIHYDDVPASSATETFESETVTWTASNASGASDAWTRVRPLPTETNHLFHGDALGSITDVRATSPALTVGNGNLSLSFKHRHQFEQDPTSNWDGAVIELSEDGGQTWNDISQYGNPGYGGPVGDPTAGNPLLGRDGYVGENAAWPNMDTVNIDLGNGLAGKTIQIRFRIGTDEVVGTEGWDIDDLAFVGLAGTPFSGLIDDQGICNEAPMADAGPDQTVPSGTVVTLDASSSSDPDGDQLTFEWTQVAGPSATLDSSNTVSPTFTAPDVMADTTLTFEVTVSDGVDSDVDTVDVIVQPPGGVGGAGGGVGGAGGGVGGAGGGVGGAGGGVGGAGGGVGGAGGGVGGAGGGVGGAGGAGGDAGGGVGGTGGDDDGLSIEGGCACSVPGTEAPAPVREAGGSLLALAAALLLRRRRNGKN
ncbi:M36 family metallopeptidase [Polyangium aurulentum]|uniref:M36 family metallopeptidase n=1 Tax=Polyangium aurulentum TaxID=2567896 RepID=UPI0010AE0109|nr:M36 family metallopeptidase [Polyangium aurulentum]UQA62765.1 M36 family metallopeptidase [Polyangium aurulentum]